jgi:hypothetical protein
VVEWRKTHARFAQDPETRRWKGRKQGGRLLVLRLRQVAVLIEYLLNFGASLMKDGIKRIVNGLEDESLGVFGSWREPGMKR